MQTMQTVQAEFFSYLHLFVLLILTHIFSQKLQNCVQYIRVCYLANCADFLDLSALLYIAYVQMY